MLSHSCCRSGGMADALDSKSGASDGMRVRPPPSAPFPPPQKITEKCVSIFLGSRTVSLSRSSGETLVVRSTKLSFILLSHN